MANVVVLQDWEVRMRSTDPYCPPECNYNCLSGFPHGHPTKDQQRKVITSGLAKVEGRMVTTKSGTVYQLGRINPKYRAWLKEKGIAYNPAQPIVDKTKAGT